MTKHIFTCINCGKEWKSNISEYDAEMKSNTIPCKCSKNIKNLTNEELKKILISQGIKL